jgi:PAS domain S-box-containing protein
LDQMTDAVIALDRDGRIALWNRAAERFSHLSAPEALGRTPKEAGVYPWLTPEDEQEALQAVTSAGIWRGEAMRPSANGQAMYLESTITALAGTDGQPNGLLAVIRDITTAKRKELEQEECIDRLHSMLNRLKLVLGLIPICSHCKRIRDEHGSWHDVEVYIGERLGMKFSHGICPTCFQTLQRDCFHGPQAPR